MRLTFFFAFLAILHVNAFSQAPEINNVTPKDGPAAGGTPVTLTGNYYTTTADTDVLFDGVSATDLLVLDSQTLTCTTPAHSAGDVDVTVINSNGSGTLTDGFTVMTAPPTVSSVSPDFGYQKHSL